MRAALSTYSFDLTNPEKKINRSYRKTFCFVLLIILSLIAVFALAFAVFYVTKSIIDQEKSQQSRRDLNQLIPNSYRPFFDVEGHLPNCTERPLPIQAQKSCGNKPIFRLVDSSLTDLYPEIQDEEAIGKFGHWEGVKPLRYDLNLTFLNDGLDFTGKVSILLQAKKEISRIPVNMDTNALQSPHLAEQIVVQKRCSSQKICIKAVTVLTKLQTVIIEPENPIRKGEFFTVLIPNFSGAAYDDLHQNGSVGLFWAHGMKNYRGGFATSTIFQMRNARTVFPCLDHPSLKAKFVFCAQHPRTRLVLSNTEAQTFSRSGNGFETCFKKTPILPTYVFTFSLISGLVGKRANANGVIVNESKDAKIKVWGPHGELDKLEWIFNETVWALDNMETMSNTKYSLSQLTFLNLKPTPFWGIENYGLVTMDLGWTSYPQYKRGHQILIHEIIHQWVGNLFTVRSWSEICLQEALTSFLEWSLSSHLKSVQLNLTATISQAVMSGLTIDDSRNPIIRTDFKRTQDIQDRCFTKPPLAFSMLSEIFGKEIFGKFLTEMAKLYSYRNAGLDEWAEVFRKVAGSTVAAKLVKNFFRNPGYPVLFAKKTSATEVAVSQKIFRNDSIVSMSSERDAFVIPLTVKFATEKTSPGSIHKTT